MEVLVSMLILGLSVSGLFAFLRLGQMNYTAISEDWRHQLILSDLRRSLRRLISNGTIFAPSSQNLVEALLPASSPIRLEKVRLNPYHPDSVFVSADFFADTNRNGRRDLSETTLHRLWCFRQRSPK